jgi:hypothetical protein
MALRSACDWVGKGPPDEPEWQSAWFRHLRVQIDKSEGWIKDKDRSEVERSYEARTHLDTLLIATACMHEGEFDASVWQRLDSAGWRRPPPMSAFAAYLAFELRTAEVAPELSETATMASAVEITGRSPLGLEFANLNAGRMFFVADPDPSRSNTVLLTPDTDEARAARTSFLDDVFPFIQIARLKCAHQRRRFEEFRRGRASQRAYELDVSLKDYANEALAGDLASLEAQCWRIARVQPDFAELISTGEEILHAVRINHRNLKTLLADPRVAPASAATDLGRAMVDPIHRDLEQIQLDLAYDKITQTQADSVLRGIETIASIRSNQAGRTLNKILLVLAATAIAQVFPKPPDSLNKAIALSDDVWKVILILVISPLLYGVVRLSEIWPSRRWLAWLHEIARFVRRVAR